MPDGLEASPIQFKSALSPDSWLYRFASNGKTGYVSQNVDKQILKEIANIADDDYEKSDKSH